MATFHSPGEPNWKRIRPRSDRWRSPTNDTEFPVYFSVTTFAPLYSTEVLWPLLPLTDADRKKATLRPFQDCPHNTVHLLTARKRLSTYLRTLDGTEFHETGLQVCAYWPNGDRCPTTTQHLTPRSGETKAKVRMLWVRLNGTVHAKVSIPVMRELCTYFRDAKQQLPSMQDQTVRFFDCEMQTWDHTHVLQRAIDCNESSAYFLTTEGGLFICGGLSLPEHIRLRSAYHLDHTCRLHSLPSMLSPRSAHGLVQFSSRVYVFGTSWNGTLKVTDSFGEFIVLNEPQAWVATCRPMKYEGGCNPCLYYSKVYLCRGRICELEVYSPSSDSVWSLTISVEHPKEAPFVMWTSGESLVAFTGSHLVRLKAHGDSLSMVSSHPHDRVKSLRTNSAPVVWREAVYVISGYHCIWMNEWTGKVMGKRSRKETESDEPNED